MKFSLGKWLKRLFFLFLFLFISSNFVLYNHAYYFTHFVDKDLPKVTSQTIGSKSMLDKIKLGIFGVEIPKPRNSITPDSTYKAVTLGSKPQLHAWMIQTHLPPKGVMILFHGYSVSKSSLLGRAKVLRRLGYHTFLVDTRGHGDSEGFQTSIGYYEAEDVQTAYKYIQLYYEDLPISLLGTSMGAVSILKAVHDYGLSAEKIILECPFRSLSDAVYSRFENLKIPTFVLPELLLFWGGIQNNMDCKAHNSLTYAKKVSLPTLVIYGKKDEKVRRQEVDNIFNALASTEKRLAILENSGHDHLMADDVKAWTKEVWAFLEH
jgi:alpha-beta hydrolase superfamily lysophospholipase